MHCKYFVYILKSLKDQKYYTGITNNLERRLSEHNNGKNISTKSRRPFKMLYYEIFPDRLSARLKEKYFKTAAGRKFLKSIIPG